MPGPPKPREQSEHDLDYERARAEARAAVQQARVAIQVTWFEEGLRPPKPKPHRHPEGGIT